MNNEQLYQRVKQLALDAVRFCNVLPKTSTNSILSKQLIRSATSAAANYRAARCSRSKREWISKISITIEEIDETNFWLDFFQSLSESSNKKISILIQESEELTKIFGKMRATARKNQQQKNSTTSNPKNMTNSK